jgi:anti-anti-sigma factor
MTTHRPRLGIEQEGPLAIVTFNDGRILDTIVIREIRAEFETLIGEIGMRQMLVDFSGVEALSSSALGVLIFLRDRLKAVQGTLMLAGLSADLAHLLAVTKLDRVFDVYADREEALAAFQKQR